MHALFYPKSLTFTEICDDNTLFYKCLLKLEYWPLIDLVVDYLYRVLASNDAGTGQSPWVYGKTKEGGTHLLWTKKLKNFNALSLNWPVSKKFKMNTLGNIKCNSYLNTSTFPYTHLSLSLFQRFSSNYE